MNLQKHKYLMLQILKSIYEDVELSSYLGFKGGTALMFFYDLPRFSVDLDFNLIDLSQQDNIYTKIRKILCNFGTIHDEAMKFYGPIFVLNYGLGERKLKIEITNRVFDNHYEIKNLLGISVKVMCIEDMFAHKLCALLDRTTFTNRDLFDIWFFLKKRTAINPKIIEERMNMDVSQYIEKCIQFLEILPDKKILDGLGDLMDESLKNFVKTKLRLETIQLLYFFKNNQIIK